MPMYSSNMRYLCSFFAYYSLLIILTLASSRVRYLRIPVIILWFLPSVSIFVLFLCDTSTANRGDEQRISITPIAASQQPPHAGGQAQSSIAAIPAFVYENNLDSSAGGGGETLCSVCLEAVKGGEMVRKLPVCEHVFHVGCIDMWLGTHSTCPNCRSTVGPPEEARTVPV